MGSVSYGLGADLSLPPCLSVTIGIWTIVQKATHGPKSHGKSFGTTLWHHVQRYCCFGVLFAHAQVTSNSSSYHIRGNEMNWLGASEKMKVFTSFTRVSFLNMRADQSSSWLTRTSFPKSTIFQPFFLTIAFAKCPKMAIISHFLNIFFKYLDLFKTDFFALFKSKLAV